MSFEIFSSSSTTSRLILRSPGDGHTASPVSFALALSVLASDFICERRAEAREKRPVAVARSETLRLYQDNRLKLKQ